MSHTNFIESVAPAMWRKYYPFDPFDRITWLDAAWVPCRGGYLDVTRVAFPTDDHVEFSRGLDDIPGDFIAAIEIAILGATMARETRLLERHARTAEEKADQLHFASKLDEALRAKGIEPGRVPRSASVIDKRRPSEELFVVVDAEESNLFLDHPSQSEH